MARTVKTSICDTCVHRDVCLYTADFNVAKKMAEDAIMKMSDSFIQHIFNTTGLGIITCRHYQKN